jgi:Clp amino terminal domain, pathogenicity island component
MRLLRKRGATMVREFAGRRGRALLDAAGIEAIQLGHGFVGTAHLVLACLADAPGILDASGVPLDEVRAEVAAALGGRTASRLDAEALASIGIDLDEVRARIEERFGPGALERTRAVRGGCGMPVRPEVKLALERARRGDARGEVLPERVLLEVIRRGDPAGAALLARWGVTETALESELRRLTGEAA